MLECPVFVHREIGIKRTRIVVRPGLLQQQNEPNQWKMSWTKQSVLLTNQEVHMLSIGGTISTTDGRVSISMSPADGGTLAQIVGDLFMKKAA